MRDDTNTATAIAPPRLTRLVAETSLESCALCLIGESASARALRAAIAALAPSDSPLLLRGATGTGKRDVAEELHRRSRRGALAFSVLDFGAADESRTGHAARGLSVLAGGGVKGTAYIPAFETLSPAQQGELIRALSVWPRPARVILGTSADIDQLCLIGRLRTELSSLLTVRLALPPLRDRIDDVASIAERCIHGWSQATYAAPLLLRESAIAQLCRYSWPGNIGELEEVVATVCTRAGGRALTADAISAALGRRPLRHAGSDVVSLRDVEQDYIVAAIVRCGHNHSLAARRLGIGRSTLARKLREMPAAQLSYSAGS